MTRTTYPAPAEKRQVSPSRSAREKQFPTRLPSGLSPVPKGRRANIRISSYNTNEPHFGRTASHRFDDPRREYGTCYFGLNLATAVAELLLHDLEPVGTQYQVAAEEVNRRFIHTFEGTDLRLANLTGQGMNVLGAHAGLFGMANYGVPMHWSRAIVDGILYVSRMMAPNLAVVLFDRDGSITLTQSKPSRALANSAGFAKVRKTLHIAYT